MGSTSDQPYEYWPRFGKRPLELGLPRWRVAQEPHKKIYTIKGVRSNSNVALQNVSKHNRYSVA